MITVLPDFENYEEIKKFVESKEFEKLDPDAALEVLDRQQQLFFEENKEVIERTPKLEEAFEIPEYLEALNE